MNQTKWDTIFYILRFIISIMGIGFILSIIPSQVFWQSAAILIISIVCIEYNAKRDVLNKLNNTFTGKNKSIGFAPFKEE